MFGGLDDIQWETLTHAYGPAGDVPGLIRALASGDDKKIGDAIYALFGNIYHQGTVYEASAPAVPFLAEALGYLAPTRQAEVLGLLAALAQGHGYYDVHRHLSFARKAMETSWVSDPDATLDVERSIVRETTLAVFAQWSTIAKYLDAPDRGVRFAAMHTLSVLAQNDASDPAAPDEPRPYLGVRPHGTAQGHWAQDIIGRLDGILAATGDSVERAACLSALSQIGARGHPALQLDQASRGTAFEQLVIVRSCAIRELQNAAQLPEAFTPLIADLAVRFEELTAALKSGVWPWDEDLYATLLGLFARLPDSALDRVAADCAGLLRNAPSLLFQFDTVLFLILGDPAPRIPDDPCKLSPGRREIARAFLEKPKRHGDHWWFWSPRNGNASAACARFNVPHDRDVWRKWLGLPRT